MVFFFPAIFESNIVTQRFQYFIIRFEIKTFCNKEPLFNSFIRYITHIRHLARQKYLGTIFFKKGVNSLALSVLVQKFL